MIDDWTTFDNERFKEIIENSDTMELVTADELNMMKNVKAVLVDSEWFQVYDNHNKMTETYVASGQYWNYFYNVWKTVSSSPFSNAIVFVTGEASAEPTTVTGKVANVDVSEVATIYEIETDERVEFIQTEALTKKGIAVHKYGAIIIPKDKLSGLTTLTVEVKLGAKTYTKDITLANVKTGDTITFNAKP